MTPEEKLALEAKEKEEFEASLEGLSDEDKAKKIAEKEALSKNTDIEEALKAEREKREEAERKLAETRAKAKENFEKRKKEREQSGEDDDKPLTRAEYLALRDADLENQRKQSQESQVRTLAKGITESDSEAELVVEVWKNRQLAGTLEEQLSEAHAIATYKRTKSMNAELKRALANKDGVITDGANAQRKPAPVGEPKINQTDKTVLAGYTWDNARGAYRKLIAGGRKVLFVSRDLKKRWSEDAPKK